jgi:hypothetical protein
MIHIVEEIKLLRFLHVHIAICVPSLVEIAPGVPELCSNIHTHPLLYR